MKTFADFGIDLGGRAGVEVQATCPQCSHTRKKPRVRCLSVNTDKGVWFCHHCEWAGSLKRGLEERPIRQRLLVKPPYAVPSSVPTILRDWFAKRGISEDVILRHGIKLQDAYMPQFEAEVPCLLFPYQKTGEVVNIKFRALAEKTFRQVPHAEKVLFGLDDLTEEWAVIVEGECDKLALEVAGVRNTVSVPDGAPPAGSKPSEQKFEYLTTCAVWLDKLTKIVLAVDNDPPGKTLEAELARRLGPERCWRVTWPTDCKDANDMLIRYGPDALREVIERATPFPLSGVVTVADVAEDVVTLYREGMPGGVSTGWQTVDAHYTVRSGELTVVTGIPSHGKSQFIDALMVNLAREHGWRFAVCSPENLPVQRHVAKLIEQWSGFPFREGPSMRLPKEELVPALEWLHNHFTFLAPEETPTIPDLLKTAKSLVSRCGIRGLVADPWNEFDHARAAGQTETEYISLCLTQVRRFARTYGVHVWLVAHPQKLYRRDDGSYPVPTPYDISGSAHWRNKADNCLTVWRDENEPDEPTILYVQKIRFREVGKVGAVKLQYNKVNGQYGEIPDALVPHWTERIGRAE